jgi:hypothetical protein
MPLLDDFFAMPIEFFTAQVETASLTVGLLPMQGDVLDGADGRSVSDVRDTKPRRWIRLRCDRFVAAYGRATSDRADVFAAQV